MPSPITRRKSGSNWIPDDLWGRIRRYMPIPCVDIILENSGGEVLVGWRRILPYRNVWALPGGRVLKGEVLKVSARRILAEYGLSARELFLVGVFPARFPSRFDFTVCLAAKYHKGLAKPDGREFTRFCWTKQLPPKLGANYRRMMLRWRQMKRMPQALQFDKLPS